MTSHPSQEELFTLRHLAEQAQNPNADVQQIYEHLSRTMQDMQALRAELHSVQTQSQNGSLQSLTSAIQTFATQHAEVMAASQQQQAQVQNILDHLAFRGNVAAPRVQVPSPLQPKFNGTSSVMPLIEFQSKLITASKRYPEALATDKSRINYALQSMEGPPALFFAPFVNGTAEDSDGMLESYDAFITILDEMYGDQSSVDEINHKLTRLRQTGPMSDYVSQFRVLAARSGWNEPALLSRFKDGLSHEVRSLLTANAHLLTTLRETQNAAILAYQNIQNRNRFQRSPQNQSQQPHRRTPAFHSASSVGPSPMEVDAIKTKHISAEEKQRRRENNLCLYCGGKDHYNADCPVKKARLAAVTIFQERDSENDQA